MAARSKRQVKQQDVRRFGASLGLIALALLVSRYVTPSGASSPLVLLGATAAVAYFGGRWPALLATATAATVNGMAVGLDELPRLAVESSMIVFLGTVLAFRIPTNAVDVEDSEEPISVAAANSQATKTETTASSDSGATGHRVSSAIQAPAESEESLSDQEPLEAFSETPLPESRITPSLLIVHGNAVLRLALRSTLTGLGYPVQDVANISQAAALLGAEVFDAVVLEIGRVDDAALAAVERVRGVPAPASKHCFVIVLASVESQDDRELLQAAGADCVLKKPIDTTGVAAKIQERFPMVDGRAQSRVGLGASP